MVVAGVADPGQDRDFRVQMSAVSDRGYNVVPRGNENCIKGGDLDRSLNVRARPLSDSLQIILYSRFSCVQPELCDFSKPLFPK
jgi:hypothetical protein